MAGDALIYTWEPSAMSNQHKTQMLYCKDLQAGHLSEPFEDDGSDNVLIKQPLQTQYEGQFIIRICWGIIRKARLISMSEINLRRSGSKLARSKICRIVCNAVDAHHSPLLVCSNKALKSFVTWPWPSSFDARSKPLLSACSSKRDWITTCSGYMQTSQLHMLVYMMTMRMLVYITTMLPIMSLSMDFKLLMVWTFFQPCVQS